MTDEYLKSIVEKYDNEGLERLVQKSENQDSRLTDVVLIENPQAIINNDHENYLRINKNDQTNVKYDVIKTMGKKALKLTGIVAISPFVLAASCFAIPSTIRIYNKHNIVMVLH